MLRSKENLGAITKVTFAGKSLDFVSSEDGTAIKILLTPFVTKKKVSNTALDGRRQIHS